MKYHLFPIIFQHPVLHNMLAKIGITIGKGNKLELDEDALKQADISSLKTVFTGYNSFGKHITVFVCHSSHP